VPTTATRARLSIESQLPSVLNLFVAVLLSAWAA